MVLSPLNASPAGDSHPFSYAAYEGARAFFELLDERAGDNPVDVAKELEGTSIFDVLRG